VPPNFSCVPCKLHIKLDLQSQSLNFLFKNWLNSFILSINKNIRKVLIYLDFCHFVLCFLFSWYLFGFFQDSFALESLVSFYSSGAYMLTYYYFSHHNEDFLLQYANFILKPESLKRREEK
jgi:hypothetical protein